MPNPGADAPLRKVTLNLYEEDCVWLEQNLGYGWSQWVRERLHSFVTAQKQGERNLEQLGLPKRYLGDLLDD